MFFVTFSKNAKDQFCKWQEVPVIPCCRGDTGAILQQEPGQISFTFRSVFQGVLGIAMA